MRFEMGVELAERLPKTSEVSVRAAVGALPSITPIGMAALSRARRQLQRRRAGRQARRSHRRRASCPISSPGRSSQRRACRSSSTFALDELLSLQPSKLAKKLEGAQVVVVRSQEIDHAGETGFTFQARQVMDTVIDNLARAIRKLAAAGVEHAVVSADHGHLFFASDRDESMRTDAPGGDTVELHRRCWIGRGGATPPGCVRVAASRSATRRTSSSCSRPARGVFKAGGDLAFHHGGPSLQELVIPVLTVRTKVRESARPSAGPSPRRSARAVTNRIFSVTLAFGEKQIARRDGNDGAPAADGGGKQVGAVGMAVDAEFDRATGA
jgi:hypothetical protein